MKIHEVAEHPGDEDSKPEPHYHTWYCGCKTRLEKGAFVIIPCSETCHIYLAVMEEGKKNEKPTR